MRRALIQIFLLHLFLCISVSNALAVTKVLVIPKGSRASFWKNLGYGALHAGREFGLTVSIRGPRYEDNHNAQTYIVDYGIKNQYDAIVLAPNHEAIAADILNEAVANNIRIVLVDSDMTSEHHSTLVASDNDMAGKMAANHIATILGNSGRIILARHIRGHGSTQKREEAFLDTLQTNFPKIKVIADPYVGASKGEAFHVILGLLNQETIDAIFCDSEEASLGILKALKNIAKENRPRFIGFDFNETIRQAIIRGDMDATIVQNPYQMGYKAVTIANQLIENQDVPEKVYTDLILVTQENIESSKVLKVINQYLSQNSKK
ncbi:substrate-binding domain-containing protein [Desulforhopalus sp. 52FAK]